MFENVPGVANDSRYRELLYAIRDLGYSATDEVHDAAYWSSFLVADPTFPGCWLRVRILGVFSMHDEKGVDAKLICVLEHDPQWDGARDIDDVPEHLRNEIAHFFSIYKDLEPEKSTEVQGFGDREAALAELEACQIAYRATYT